MAFGLVVKDSDGSTIFNSENAVIERKVDSFTTGTSAGSGTVSSNFNLTDGNFFPSFNNTTYTDADNVLPRVTYNDTTKALSWSFETWTPTQGSLSINWTQNEPSVVDIETISPKSMTLNFWMHAGDPSDDAAGVVVRNDDSETIIDDTVQNVAVIKSGEFNFRSARYIRTLTTDGAFNDLMAERPITAFGDDGVSGFDATDQIAVVELRDPVTSGSFFSTNGLGTDKIATQRASTNSSDSEAIIFRVPPRGYQVTSSSPTFTANSPRKWALLGTRTDTTITDDFGLILRDPNGRVAFSSQDAGQGRYAQIIHRELVTISNTFLNSNSNTVTISHSSAPSNHTLMYGLIAENTGAFYLDTVNFTGTFGTANRDDLYVPVLKRNSGTECQIERALAFQSFNGYGGSGGTEGMSHTNGSDNMQLWVIIAAVPDEILN